MKAEERSAWIETLRVLATLLVLLNHVPAVTAYCMHGGFFRYAYLTLTLFDRINVPLFFMISGALLLEKKEDFSVVMKKRIPRFALLLFLAELGIFLLNALISFHHGTAADLSPLSFVRSFLAGNIPGAGSYWFFYAYLSFLLMLPFLRPIAAAAGKRELILLILGHGLVWSVLPFVNYCLLQNGQKALYLSQDLSFPLAVVQPFFYTLCGYFLARRVSLEKLKAKHLWLLFAASLAGIALSAACTLGYGRLKGINYTEEYFRMFDYVTAVFVFLLIRYLMEKKHPALSKGRFAAVMRFLGPLCLGIYLLDPVWKLTLYPVYSRLNTQETPALWFSLGWIALSFIAGGIVTRILKFIPFIKRLL